MWKKPNMWTFSLHLWCYFYFHVQILVLKIKNTRVRKQISPDFNWNVLFSCDSPFLEIVVHMWRLRTCVFSLFPAAGTISGEEMPIIARTNIKEHRDSFSCEKFDFRLHHNITFYVYVSNFSWPIKIQVRGSVGEGRKQMTLLILMLHFYQSWWMITDRKKIRSTAWNSINDYLLCVCY